MKKVYCFLVTIYSLLFRDSSQEGVFRKLFTVWLCFCSSGPVVGASLEGPPIYSAETLAIAVTTACVAALVIGFISGFLFSRKCRGDEYAHTYSETPYLDSKLNK